MSSTIELAKAKNMHNLSSMDDTYLLAYLYGWRNGFDASAAMSYMPHPFKSHLTPKSQNVWMMGFADGVGDKISVIY